MVAAPVVLAAAVADPAVAAGDVAVPPCACSNIAWMSVASCWNGSVDPVVEVPVPEAVALVLEVAENVLLAEPRPDCGGTGGVQTLEAMLPMDMMPGSCS